MFVVGPIREWGGKYRVWCNGYRASDITTRELTWISCDAYYVTK